VLHLAADHNIAIYTIDSRAVYTSATLDAVMAVADTRRYNGQFRAANASRESEIVFNSMLLPA
jgi:hypothetical protein